MNRYETDVIGSLEIPENAYYGIHSLRASRNFDITRYAMQEEFIRTLVQVKKAAAMANAEAGGLSEQKARAIAAACDLILENHLTADFIVDPIQGGAGTSVNMNANEVIANHALELLGCAKGRYDVISPNDDVNMSQSTNDVFPTAGKITAVKMLKTAEQEMRALADALQEKAEAFKDVFKMGRTQLQDAVPVSVGQEFAAYASATRRSVCRLEKAQDELRTVNIGGTAIGTSVNASKGYVETIASCLRRTTGVEVMQADDLIDATQNLDGFVVASGLIKACAVSLSKMCNDLRLLSSGPRTGLSEIFLPAVQSGSSIMPGKINPVIPEVVSQVAFNIIGNDMTITMAAEGGQLELNAFEPVLLFKIFESIGTLGNAAHTLTENCIRGIKVNRENCRRMLERSIGVVTALCPKIGYKKASELAKKALMDGKAIRDVVREEHVISPAMLDALLDPARLVHPLSR